MQKYSFFRLSLIVLISTFYYLSVGIALSTTIDSSHQNPERFIGSIFDAIIEASSVNLKDTEKVTKMIDLFDKNVDYMFVARAVLGSSWKKASDEQKIQFSVALKDYLAKKYSKQFFEFKSEKIQFKGINQLNSNSFIINSRVISENAKSFDVAWQVVKKKAELKVINVKFEGISMIHTERDEIRSLMKTHSGSIPLLIKVLRDY